jgi:transposase
VLIESLVRKTLAVKDHCVASAVESTDGLLITLEKKQRHRLPCSGCGFRGKVYDTLPARRWRHAPLWGFAAFIAYAPRRVDCPRCGVKVEKIPWGPSKSSISLPLITMLAFWSRLLAMDVVAGLFGVSFNTVSRAVNYAVNWGLQRRDLSDILYIGVDEISRRRGHIYHTQVYDLVERRLLFSAEGRAAKDLQAFLEQLGPERCAQIEGVCCDMWAPYYETVKEYCPNAIIVFDKFHIIRHLLDAVDQVRRQEMQKLDKEQAELLKGTRYIWLKNPWNLTPQQKQRLGFLEKLNLKINRAYLLKESFMQLYQYKKWGWAKRFLDQWRWWATHSRLKPIRDFARMLKRHADNILSYFDLPMTNGSVEAMNNNAKAVSRRARGFRTAEWFSTILLHCLGRLPLPQTTHKFW